MTRREHWEIPGVGDIEVVSAPDLRRDRALLLHRGDDGRLVPFESKPEGDVVIHGVAMHPDTIEALRAGLGEAEKR